jgi:acyl-CoA synthetase (AMP-forming)/AMP-acid ligase II
MNIVDPIHQHALTRPTDVALIFPDGQLTWQQLDSFIRRSAHHLASQGIKHGDLVGLAFENPVLHLLTAFGLAKIGAVHVALPFDDPAVDRKKTSEFLGIGTIISDKPQAETLKLRIIGLTGFPNPHRNPMATENSDPVTGEHSWLLIRSSGTTGQPKYAELSHRVSLERFARWSDAYQYTKGDVFWIGIGLNTITGKQHTISALQAGAAVCIPAGLNSYVEIVKFVRSCGTTLAYHIPSHLWNLVSISGGSPILPKVRRFFSGTTEVSDELRKEFTKKVTPNLYTNYGTNEAPCATVSSPQLNASIKDTIGIAHKLLDLEIVDTEDTAVGKGVTGQVRLRGPGIISEYYRNPEATLKSFKAGWFYPGDLAFVTSDGAVVLQGRSDEMLIYDGVNIYPAEIERALCENPLISEAVAFSLKHERFKDEPVAAVITKSPLDEQDLINWIQARLGIKSPRKIFIVNEFPRSSSGKILRRELTKQYQKVTG